MPCSPDFHQKSFRIKHDDDKFFTRLLSKETSNSNPSFRVYYGDVPSAVPFTWETRPGTPKHAFSENSHIPPLTPPPSYYTNKFNNSSKKNSRSKLLLHTLLRRMSPKKAHSVDSSYSSSSLSSLSWSSSSHSSFSDPMMTPTYKRRRFSSWGSSFDERTMNDRRDEVCPSRSCLGAGKDKGDRLRGCYSVFIVKKALFSIVGRGSA
ncbi:hypothetical protein CDL12_11607 [Handroanthus impetiginosus]|uniref:Uncharacterized protein n=1 Tax=Handroanthus impetiginosus TaxID=429701 RepID=A0A2G9HE26_9LAMI|nr:hypothetical protein CDL12_11607 [Handroanthus impetiginosus]